MLRLIRSLSLMAAMVSALAYLGLSVAMAGGDVAVIEGQVVKVADLCGGGAGGGTDCPFCALAAAVTLPEAGAALRPGGVRPLAHLPQAHVVARPVAARLRPPVRAPPPGLV